MESVPQAVHFYGENRKYYPIESYTRICNVIAMILEDMKLVSSSKTDANYFGIVEYVTIDNVLTETKILDFNERVLDWRARQQRVKDAHLSKHS